MKWINAKDTRDLPHKKECVLLAVDGKVTYGWISCFLAGRKPLWLDWKGEIVEPSHWMSKPIAPIDKKQDLIPEYGEKAFLNYNLWKKQNEMD